MAEISIRNISELLKWGETLDRANVMFSSISQLLGGRISHLTDNWDDDNAHAFQEELKQIIEQIDSLSNKMQCASSNLKKFHSLLNELKDVKLVESNNEHTSCANKEDVISIEETLRQMEEISKEFLDTNESTPMSFDAALEELNNIIK